MVWLAPALVLAVDQTLKIWLMQVRPEWVVINYGIAFSVGSSWLIGVGLILFCSLGWQYRFEPRWIWVTILVAFLSNVADRARVGGVVDYASIGTLHFNFADIVILALIGTLIYRANQEKQK